MFLNGLIRVSLEAFHRKSFARQLHIRGFSEIGITIDHQSDGDRHDFALIDLLLGHLQFNQRLIFIGHRRRLHDLERKRGGLVNLTLHIDVLRRNGVVTDFFRTEQIGVADLNLNLPGVAIDAGVLSHARRLDLKPVNDDRGLSGEFGCTPDLDGQLSMIANGNLVRAQSRLHGYLRR